MAFNREPSRLPVAIGDIEVRLMSPDPGSGINPSSAFAVEVKYNDGTSKTLQGNLTPHLTQAQVNGLLSFMAALRTQAEQQILP